MKFEELETVLCEVESVINQRPLCYSNDEDLEESPTPNHLIFGKKFSESKFHRDELMTADQTRFTEFLEAIFRHVFRSELRQHHMYRYPKVSDSTLQLNDVVLIRDDIPLPRSKWKTGKIEELIVRRDGHLHGGKLKVNTDSRKCGFIHRPLQKIIPFEISKKNNGDTVADTPSVPDTENDRLSLETSTEQGDARDENQNKDRVARRAAVIDQHLEQLRHISICN